MKSKHRIMNIKTFLIIGLTGILGLGSCTRAQIGKQIIDLDNLNYDLDAAYYYSTAIDEDQTDSMTFAGTKQEIEIHYRKDTLKYYNTETDELYPPLVVYRHLYGDMIVQGTFCGYDFMQLDMVTTEENKLVQVKGKMQADEEGLAKLTEAVTKKYGEPYFEEGEEYMDAYSVYRWETKDEYIQLHARHNTGKGTIIIEVTGDENEPVKMENDNPHWEVTLSRWKKRYHDLVIAEAVCSLLDKEKERRDNEFHVANARFYTPEEIRPFFITTHYLDSLEHSGNVWEKIEASFYHRIPNSRIIDPTGIMDSVKINQEGCIPVWGFGAHIKGFKDGMSNAAYIVRLMKQGRKFHDMMDDAELCRKRYEGEAEWKEKKRFAGVVYLDEDERGNIILARDYFRHSYYTLYRTALIITDEVKQELEKSGLNLEKMTARCFEFPGLDAPAAYFTDGEQEKFMFIGDSNRCYGTKTKEWCCSKVYPIIEYLKEVM